MTQKGSLTPGWADLIRNAIEQRLLDLHTGLPAKIQSYDAATQSCEAQPLLRRAFRDENENISVVDTPVLTRIPVQFPAGGGWVIRWPLVSGDIVYLSFAERSLDRWKSAPAGTNVDPIESRKHHLSDAIAIPGIRPRGAAGPNSGNDLIIAREDGSSEIRMRPDGGIEFGPNPVNGVARLEDSIQVNATTDSAFVQWMVAVHAFILGASSPASLPVASEAYAASVPTPPTTATGTITSASSDVRSK